MFKDRTLSGPEEKFPHPPQPSAPVGDLDEDDTDEEDETGATRVVREEDISILRNHVQKQTKEISFQKDIIAQVRDELQKQEEHTRRALTKVENKDVVLLKQELRKHQQANKASQKALREISGILTQVAIKNRGFLFLLIIWRTPTPAKEKLTKEELPQ
ncbi:hypothetical protein CNMCM7691_008591 [Aspergillus felis]|uniref:Uncharacterized protein n=1 Tax=Aspergillus felis TaxID=1287682 RepID=A0A8H6V6C5_9EURO|nr:hypothetical protein CNMCM7691_008591 [Aspergillus felis]